MKLNILALVVVATVCSGCENYNVSIQANSDNNKENEDKSEQPQSIEQETNQPTPLTKKIDNSIRNSKTTIEKYVAIIEKTKNALIKLKVNRKIYENRLVKKESELEVAKVNNEKASKIAIMESSITDFKSLIEQVKVEENKLQNALLKFNENIDVVKLKIEMLESKREILQLKLDMNIATDIDTTIKGVDKLTSQYTEQLDKEIIELETALEVEKLVE
jgi:hypothetical protein